MYKLPVHGSNLIVADTGTINTRYKTACIRQCTIRKYLSSSCRSNLSASRTCPLTRCQATASGAQTPPQNESIDVEVVQQGSEDIKAPESKPPNPLQWLCQFVASIFRSVLQRLLLDQQQRRGLRAGLALFFISSLMIGAGILGIAARAPNTKIRLQPPPQEVVYSQFRTLLLKGQVQSVRFANGNERIYFDVRQQQVQEGAQQQQQRRGRKAAQQAAATKQGGSGKQETEAGATLQRSSSVRPRYYTQRIYDPNLVPLLLQLGVEFGAMSSTFSSAVGRALGTILALWLPLLPIYFIMRRALDGKLGGRNKREDSVSRASPITFDDVAGMDSIQAELLEVVLCLRDSARYSRLNAKPPSGVLLCGPPGTGKTLLAKAVAGEAGVPFFAASASEFVELFVGRGAARIRDLFREARKAAPCVVFIDELDAIGGRRGMSTNEERDQTLNQLLTELDGFEGRPGVVLLAATNRPEVLDPALTRPGRLSRKVIVPLPDEPARAEILAVHLRGVPMDSKADKQLAAYQIARITRGFSGAELANVVNEAALLSGRRGQDVVTLRELLEGVQRTRFGVDGRPPAFLPPFGLQRKLMDWVVDLSNAQKAGGASQIRASTQ